MIAEMGEEPQSCMMLSYSHGPCKSKRQQGTTVVSAQLTNTKEKLSQDIPQETIERSAFPKEGASLLNMSHTTRKMLPRGTRMWSSVLGIEHQDLRMYKKAVHFIREVRKQKHFDRPKWVVPERESALRAIREPPDTGEWKWFFIHYKVTKHE